jgi:HEAT repeats
VLGRIDGYCARQKSENTFLSNTLLGIKKLENSKMHYFKFSCLLLVFSTASCVPWYPTPEKEHYKELRTSASVEQLVEALNDESVKVRGVAAEVLANRRNDALEAVPALTKALEDESAHVRRRATIALGKINTTDEAVVKCLLATLKDPDSGTRLESIRSIYALGYRGNDYIEQLKIMVITDKNRAVRNTANKIVRML